MVMCVGSTESCFGMHPRPPAHYRASIVYFPSQDAISASVVSYSSSMWGYSSSICSGGGSSNKRKLEDDSEVNLSYFDQRQSVLNISMIKLRTQPPRKEQPLRRSVLIVNTLKHIETELKVEGVQWNPLTKTSLLPSIESNDDLTLDPLPVETCSTSPESPVSMETTDNISPLVTTPEPSPATPDATPLFPESRSLFDSMFNFGPQSGPLPTFSSLLDLDSLVPSPSSNLNKSNLPTSQSSSALSPSISSSLSLPMQHSTTRSSTGSSMSYRAPSLEHDPLSDFDISSLDMDFFSFLPNSLKLTPLSPEDLQSLPHPETFPSSISSSCNPKHTDLHGDDLDSIMQILVGM